ncbi:MAG: signal peptide peptidase SppA [Kiritimatiellia bacterium]
MSEHEKKNGEGCRFGCMTMALIAGGMVALLAIVLVIGIVAVSKSFPGGAKHRFVASARVEGGEDEVPELREIWSSGSAAGTKVVRIAMSGLIMLGDSEWSESADSASAAMRAIKRATHDQEIEGILLEIDSGGGGITASDMIYQALMEFKKVRPGRVVVTLMGDIAASGAYYVSLPSDLILAHPTTITGSIGVIMQTYNIKELAAKLGIKDETFKSGENKDILNPFHDVTPEQRAMLQAVIDTLHSRFVKLVAESRKLSEADVRKLADGRIFVADEALERKLVDGIGYRADAEKEMIRLLHAKSINVVRYSEDVSVFDLLRSYRGIGSALNEFIKPRETRLMYRWWL